MCRHKSFWRGTKCSQIFGLAQKISLECLVFLQVPKCFEPVQIFWVSPKIWLHLVPLQKLLCRHKKQFYWMQIIFLAGTKCLWLAQYVNKFLLWHKKFGPAQNILRPVKGQGINLIYSCNFLCPEWSETFWKLFLSKQEQFINYIGSSKLGT